MLCPKCCQENEENTLFCKHCGRRLIKKEAEKISLPDILLLVFAVVHFLVSLITTLIQTFVDEWYFSGWRVVIFVLYFISNVTFLLPAIAIRNTILKIIAIVLAGIVAIYFCSHNISNIVDYITNG